MDMTQRSCHVNKHAFAKSAGAALLLGGIAIVISGCGALQDWRDENKGIQLESLKASAGYSRTADQ